MDNKASYDAVARVITETSSVPVGIDFSQLVFEDHIQVIPERDNVTVTLSAMEDSANATSFLKVGPLAIDWKGLILEPTPTPPAASDVWWLHVRQSSECYFLYAKYTFEAWTTIDADPNSARRAVPTITMRWRHGEIHSVENEANTHYVRKIDETYNSGCDSDICMKVWATDEYGRQAFSSAPNGCAVA